MIETSRTISTDNTIVSLPDQAAKSRTHHLSVPERTLLTAIIDQAFREATQPRSKSANWENERTHARRWFRECGGGFDDICGALSINPEPIRAAVEFKEAA